MYASSVVNRILFAFNYWFNRISMKYLLFVCLIQYSGAVFSGFTVFIYSNIKPESSAVSDETGGSVEPNRVFLKSNIHFPDRFNLPDANYTYDNATTSYIRYSTYNEFRNFLMRLRALRGHYSEAGRQFSDIQTKLKQRFYSQSVHSASAQVLSMELGSALPVIPLSVTGATNVMDHAPFDDLIDFVDSDGVLGPEACQRLYKDFLDYKELAQASRAESFLLEIFDFFLQGLTNASSCGDVAIKFT